MLSTIAATLIGIAQTTPNLTLEQANEICVLVQNDTNTYLPEGLSMLQAVPVYGLTYNTFIGCNLRGIERAVDYTINVYKQNNYGVNIPIRNDSCVTYGVVNTYRKIDDTTLFVSVEECTSK